MFPQFRLEGSTQSMQVSPCLKVIDVQEVWDWGRLNKDSALSVTLFLSLFPAVAFWYSLWSTTHTHTHINTQSRSAGKPTLFLSYFQQDRLPQLNDEGLVLLILFVINNLHLNDLPVEKRREGWDSESVFNIINLFSFMISIIIRGCSQCA